MMNKYQLTNYLICLVVTSISLGFISEIAFNIDQSLGKLATCALMLAGCIVGMRLIDVIKSREEFQKRIISVRKFLKLMGCVIGRNPQ
tara:strand:- start:398 stop:661 length:264 start_codon:yes stop_codon:yes gene_type:complete